MTSTYGAAGDLTLFPGGIATPPIPGGNIVFVDGVNGSDSKDGTSPETALLTLSHAKLHCTADHHDTVYVIPGDTGVLEAAAIDWNLDYTDVIGLGPARQVSNRARIACNATALSPFFTVSAHGCLFRNIQFWQGQNDAASKVNVKVTGVRNKFEYCHFAGGGHAAQAINGGASLELGANATENEFDHCTIGVDTIAASTGLAALLFSGTGIGAARNIFTDCNFTLYAAGTTPTGVRFVEVAGNNAIDRYTLFKKCMFLNQGTSMATAFTFEGTMDPANKQIYLVDCVLGGADNWAVGTPNTVLMLNTGTITAGGNAGLFAGTDST